MRAYARPWMMRARARARGACPWRVPVARARGACPFVPVRVRACPYVPVQNGIQVKNLYKKTFSKYSLPNKSVKILEFKKSRSDSEGEFEH